MRERPFIRNDVRGFVKDFAFGALATLALPPFYVLPLGLGGVAWLFARLTSTADITRAAAMGFFFGFGYFLGGCWWIGHSLLLNDGEFLWLLPPTLLVAPSFLALFLAASCGIFAIINKYLKPPPPAWLSFASLWTFSEWGRGMIFPHFPWNPLGSIWAFDEAFMQAAAFVGVWGLSLLTASLGALTAIAWKRKSLRIASLVVMVLVALPSLGILRLSASPAEFTDSKLYIVQPAIPQERRWRAPFKNLQLRLKMSTQALREAPSGERAILLWAETASPFRLEEGAPATELIAGLLPANAVAAAGNIRRSKRGEYYNSIAFISEEGRIEATYDKSILVPFGEYLPLRGLWQPLLGLTTTIGGIDFSRGGGARVIEPKEAPPFVPLICFESIFPSFILNTAAQRPAWLFNATNDGWFGNSPGPYQHFAAARMRAVESGLPLVRAAAGGISAVIDGNGRVVAELPLGRRGVIIEYLPAGRASFFSRFGAFITLLSVLLWTLMIILWLTLGSLFKNRRREYGY